MKPSIGRIVHFRDSNGPLAAIVTRVVSDTVVNLSVFQPDGHAPWGRTSVEQGDEVNQWNWPPRVD